MSGEIVLPGDDSNGKTCRMCARWDGCECTHPRHANDDPERPCMLYRYRQHGDDAAAGEVELVTCSKCGKAKPLSSFQGVNGKVTKTCIKCRSHGIASYRNTRTEGGMRECRSCRRMKPLSDYLGMDGRETVICEGCRTRMRKYNACKQDKKNR